VSIAHSIEAGKQIIIYPFEEFFSIQISNISFHQTMNDEGCAKDDEGIGVSF